MTRDRHRRHHQVPAPLRRLSLRRCLRSPSGLAGLVLPVFCLFCAVYFSQQLQALAALDAARTAAGNLLAAAVQEAPGGLEAHANALDGRLAALGSAPEGLAGQLAQLRALLRRVAEAPAPGQRAALITRSWEIHTALDAAYGSRLGRVRGAALWALFALVLLGLGAAAAFHSTIGRLRRRAGAPLAPIASRLTDLLREQSILRGTGGQPERASTADPDPEALIRRLGTQLGAEVGVRDAIIDSLPAEIALLDAAGRIRHVNERWRQFARDNGFAGADFALGISYVELCEGAAGEGAEGAAEVARGLRQVLAGERERFAVEYPCHGPDEQRWFRLMANRLPAVPGLEGGALVMHIDITERVLAEQRAQSLAYRDALTGLATPAALRDIMDRDGAYTGYLALLDVIEFHDINEAHGYEVGDQLLVALGRRLGNVALGDATVARYGSDAYAVYLTPGESVSPEDVAEAIQAVIRAPFRGVGFSVQLEVRMAVVALTDRPSAMEAFRRAELTLSSLRRSGTRTWRCYTPALEEANQARIRISNGLRHALEQGEFELHYQPKVDIASGELVGAEGLLRWRHPEKGLVPPAEFIPVAETSQLIVPLGEWTIFRACRDLKAWQDAGIDLVDVSVNVSVRQFALSDVAATVRAALEETGLLARSLCLEITESVFAGDIDYVRNALSELHQLGVRLALDDFGTGYSSLQYLQAYPFDEIKVDRAFVSRITAEPYSDAVVRMVQAIAGTLGATVVAEGIESRAQREALLRAGCRIGQGFYFSVPLEREDFTWLLSERGALPNRRARRTG